MVIELKNEATNDVKKVNHGVNYFLLLTSPLFGITLLKNKLNRSGIIMLAGSVLLVLSVLLFYIFSSSHASMYPYSSTPVNGTPSSLVQFYYLLDIDYEDVLEFFLTSFVVLFLFLSAMAIFVGINANKWIAEQYRFEGYKVATDNRLVYNLLKKDWGLTNSDFICAEMK